MGYSLRRVCSGACSYLHSNIHLSAIVIPTVTPAVRANRFFLSNLWRAYFYGQQQRYSSGYGATWLTRNVPIYGDDGIYLIPYGMDYPRPCSERMGGAKEAGLKFGLQDLTAFRHCHTQKSMCHGLMHNLRLDTGRLVSSN